jgi:hypothetical protein
MLAVTPPLLAASSALVPLDVDPFLDHRCVRRDAATWVVGVQGRIEGGGGAKR